MKYDLKPGNPVSWYSNSGSKHGVWRRARVKRLTSHRVIIVLEKPENGEQPYRSVTYGGVEAGWGRADEYERVTGA